jgi:thioredoxin-like negative regulator of GroEL
VFLAEQRGRFAEAADHYEQVAERFPDSTLALGQLAITRLRAGQVAEAVPILDRLEGHKTSSEVATEVNQAIQTLKSKRPPKINE